MEGKGTAGNGVPWQYSKRSSLSVEPTNPSRLRPSFVLKICLSIDHLLSRAHSPGIPDMRLDRARRSTLLSRRRPEGIASRMSS
jgi:hypothetical protein